MNNNIFFYFFFFLTLTGVSNSCTERSSNANRIYFTINPKDRKIVIPVQLNDSTTANMAFDTGWGDQAISLDSTFVATHPYLVPNECPDTLQGGTAWTDYRVLSLKYNSPITVKIGNASLDYNGIDVFNCKKALQTEDSEGIFNIPGTDTAHVWEWNFEHNYLKIYRTEDFQMPENCFLYPLNRENCYPFVIPVSMQIKCADGDTIIINDTRCTIDMALPADLALVHPSQKELEFFDRREDAIWTQFVDGYTRRYTVSATIFDNFVIDSLRIYTYSNPYEKVRSKSLIGLNFLRRFNVFFDMKNHQVGFQPIKNFRRIVNPNSRRFHISAFPNSEGKFIVTVVADYKANYYKTAGLQVGDEIVEINGKPLRSITREENIEFHKKDTLVYNIIRNGKPLKILIPIDKNEQQGD
jgi:hypothetical protein